MRMLRTSLVAAALLVAAAPLVAGCDRSPVASTSAPVVRPDIDAQRPSATELAPSARSSAGGSAGGSASGSDATIALVDAAWPARSAIDPEALERLSPRARGELDRSSVPVLVPSELGLVDSAVLVVKPAYYAASMRGRGAYEGLTVNVSATRVEHAYRSIAGVPPKHSIDVGGPEAGTKAAWITENEGIWSATFRTHGLSYVLEVECAQPSHDARCASDAELRRIAKTLRFVGGSFEGGAR